MVRVATFSKPATKAAIWGNYKKLQEVRKKRKKMEHASGIWDLGGESLNISKPSALKGYI
jgi:hypothetical protein